MKKIFPPLSLGMNGPAVANLRRVLRALLEQGGIASHDDDLRQSLLEGISAEDGAYGEATAAAVLAFQRERRIRSKEGGTVDDRTAETLNAISSELGLFDDADGRRESSCPAAVSGAVSRAQGGPASGATVRAYHEAAGGSVRLGADTVDDEGRYVIRYYPLPGIKRFDLRVSVTTADGQVTSAPVIRGASGMETVDVVLDAAGAWVYTVRGVVASPDRPAVAGLDVYVVDRNVGGDVELARVATDERGHYVATFNSDELRCRGKTAPDLQVQVRSGHELLGVSEVRYDAGNREVLDVTLPSSSGNLAAEHDILTASLAARFGGALRDLEETDGRADVTYLANKTGWDARAVAMAALADQLSQLTTDDGAAVAAPLYYALLRAGLPAAPDALFAVDPRTVERAWDAAVEARVIDRAGVGNLDHARDTFQKLAASQALEARVVGGASTLRELVAPVLSDEGEQLRFAELRTLHRRDGTTLWRAVEAEFGAERAARLRLDGQLATLTLNNAPLIAKLHAEREGEPLASPLDLARRGYFKPETWAPVVGDSVPAGVPGDSAESRRANYQALLAAQIRVSFPTQSVAEMVRAGDLALTDTAAIKEGVYGFLSEHQRSFVIGAQPIGQYLSRTGAAVEPAVADAITRLHRVYQLTPTDAAMAGMLAEGIDSAAAVARYERSEFVSAFSDALGGGEAAEQAYAKAEQVSTAVQAVMADYVVTSQAPVIGSGDGAATLSGAAGAAADAGDVIAMPTLETLLGSTDYCACEHCRSVLSPAAYLVDLLEFLDRPANALDGKENPLKVLLERRPDLEHLPLSCENTNTRMPYIDVVNETLDYLVAHDLAIVGYEGYDTEDGATADELLASPRNVDAAATEQLKNDLFPPPLPHNHVLEGLRAHLESLDAPLWSTMADLRADERLERATPPGYGWRDVLMERLRLSREEYQLLTDRTVALPDLAGYPAGTTTVEAIDDLTSAKSFCHRVGISYDELTALLSTRFVNPHAHLIPRLERLDLSFVMLGEAAAGHMGDAELRALLPAGLSPAAFDGDIVSWLKAPANAARYLSIIILDDRASGTDPCSLEGYELRLTNPDDAASKIKAIDLIRMLRFVRLWRKLGWTMQQVDAALAALTPAASLPTAVDEDTDLEALDAGLLTALPRLGVAHLLMDRLNLRPARDLYGILALWSDLDTHGQTMHAVEPGERSLSHYARLLLNPTTLDRGTAFADDGYGRHLVDPAARLLPQAETLRAAFGLTGEELNLILADLRFDEATPLTLASVTAVYRRGWLARALKISVRELLDLIQFTGLDPYAAPDIATPTPAAPLDSVLPACLRLIDLVQALRATDLKTAEALYMLWNCDLSGRSTPESALVLAFAQKLRLAFDAIAADLVVVADPTGEISRTKMALAYNAATVDAFFGLLNGTAVSWVEYSHPRAELEDAIIEAGAAQGQGRLIYDDIRKRLSFGGVMLPATRARLKAVPGGSADYATAVDQLFAETAALARALFDRYPELEPLHDAFLTSGDPIEDRRKALLDGILPPIGHRRRQQQALDAATAETDAASAFASTLLQDPTVLCGVAADSPAVDDLTAVAEHGLSATYYWRNTASDPVDLPVDAVPTLEHRPSTSRTLPANGAVPGNPISAVWRGYLDAPATGDYGISIEADAGAEVSLTVGGNVIPLAGAGMVHRNTVPVPLTAGSPTPIEVKIERVRNTAVVQWTTTGLGWEVIPSHFLYSETLITRLRDVYIRLLKAVSLATSLRLTPRELATLTTLPDERVDGTGWLNALPVTGVPSASTAAALGRRLETLLSFVEIREAMAADDERLLNVLIAPTAVLRSGERPLETVTGWSGASVDALLARMGRTRDDLSRPAIFRRIYEAFRPVQTIGISAASLIPAVTNAPEADTMTALQRALRARYAEEDWIALLKPINDRMRAMRRDASVAHVLHRLSFDPASAHIATAEKLFEYVLMDVQMEPCMETSRIRHALSSVQLFVERCMMNLEPRVSPRAIRSAHWEWMKRYRVWEANRKVFLFPENWLEAELRDDQSQPFKDTMAALLQSDITDDAAARALGGYLVQLEEIAKLEPCGIHVVERDPGIDDDLVHLVARTAGGTRKHFYRRREGGSWTPWEHAKLDIEDTPVIPVVWRDRTFLFWLKLTKEALIDPGQQPITSSPPGPITGLTMDQVKGDLKGQAAANTQMRVSAVLCWSERVNGTWTAAKTSDIERPSYIGSFDATGAAAFDRSGIKLYSGETDQGLWIWTSSGGSFLLYNTHSSPVRGEDVDGGDTDQLLLAWQRKRDAWMKSGTTFMASYYDANVFEEREILTMPIGGRAIGPTHPMQEPWVAPMVVEDGRHVFYVKTTHKAVSIAESSWHGAETGAYVAPHVNVVFPKLLKIREYRKPDPIGPIASGLLDKSGPLINPVPDEREIAMFVTEDAFIRNGIASRSPVVFNGASIGMRGRVVDRNR
ncbi:neuraminidase-like domain-containing protein [Nocardia sp. NPDC052278]|uniref:neuraminidase-like domain-containing protein n=1 Tax=unclassified Nocardia TaxID=2637762 RepID=UPI00367ED9F0